MKSQQVVVAFDFSPLSKAVLARAIGLASRAPFHVLHFVTVMERATESGGADAVRERLVAQVREALGSEQLAQTVRYFAHVRIGKPSHEILELAEEVGADLILLGTHGRTGLGRIVLGSTAEHVMREAGCPVLVVRPKRYADVELETVVEVEGHHPTSRVRAWHAEAGPFEWHVP